jgi:hypothetical protein
MIFCLVFLGQKLLVWGFILTNLIYQFFRKILVPLQLLGIVKAGDSGACLQTGLLPLRLTFSHQVSGFMTPLHFCLHTIISSSTTIPSSLRAPLLVVPAGK